MINRIHYPNIVVSGNGQSISGCSSIVIDAKNNTDEWLQMGDMAPNQQYLRQDKEISVNISWPVSPYSFEFFLIGWDNPTGFLNKSRHALYAVDTVGKMDISGSLTNYNMSASVGEIPVAEASFVADRIDYDETHTMEPQIDHYNRDFSPFIPSEITVHSNFAKPLESTGFHIQSVSLEVGITRKPLRSLGEGLSYANVAVGGDVSLSFTTIKNQSERLQMASLENNINSGYVNEGALMAIELANPSGNLIYNVSGLKLSSISEQATLDDNTQVTFTFNGLLTRGGLTLNNQ